MLFLFIFIVSLKLRLLDQNAQNVQNAQTAQNVQNVQAAQNAQASQTVRAFRLFILFRIRMIDRYSDIRLLSQSSVPLIIRYRNQSYLKKNFVPSCLNFLIYSNHFVLFIIIIIILIFFKKKKNSKNLDIQKKS